MKLVLEIKGDKIPKENDVLVFDEEKQCWKILSKNEFFKDIRKEFKVLKEEFKKTQKKCQETQDDVKQIAKIVKENV